MIQSWRISIICFCLLLPVRAISQNNAIQLLGQLTYNEILSDIWGYTAPGGEEYALVGLYSGVSIVDIHSDPSNPVELFKIDGSESTWRDIKTYGHYAYAVNESDSGLLIINLMDLPTKIDFHHWQADSNKLFSAHNLFIDENGTGFIFGSNINNGGALIMDLATDPENPSTIGIYDNAYIHDGYVSHDTLWAAEVYEGQFSVIDVSNPSKPEIIASVFTPDNFTHNIWLSDDRSTAFTTDERQGAFVTAFDVSDIDDIEEIGTFRMHPEKEVIPHNTFYHNGYLITSYYRDGVVITDAKHPDNLIRTGWYDTSPFDPAPGFQGCWGVYPYFPSGTIVASDRQEGLFVLNPTYYRACYLEGLVTDLNNSTSLQDVQIEILHQDLFSYSSILGKYHTGIGQSGYYDIRISKSGCQTQIISNVKLQNDSTTVLNIQMDCINTGLNLEENPEISIQHFNERLEIILKNHTWVRSEFHLFDINGRLQMSSPLEAGQTNYIQLRDQLPSGIYLAMVSTINGSFTRKIFVN